MAYRQCKGVPVETEWPTDSVRDKMEEGNWCRPVKVKGCPQ